MVLGLFLSLFNHIHYRSWVKVFFKFIPEILLLLSLFGYMDFLIIYKWMTSVEGHNKPMLIRTMIDMFLSIGDIKDDERLYDGQEDVQLALVILDVICIIWLLVPTPIIRIIQHRMKVKRVKERKMKRNGKDNSNKKADERTGLVDSSNLPRENENNYDSGSIHKINNGRVDEGLGLTKGIDYPLNLKDNKTDNVTYSTFEPVNNYSDEEELREEEEIEEFSIGELLVNQLIDVIEYVLGCVSNTASYLRLWALSLAHGELSEVFFDYLIINIPKIVPVFGFLVGVPGWIGTTVAILLAMEGLSAFLHDLRLHWVEFQNKFYIAEGYPFEPFSFKQIDMDALESLSADGASSSNSTQEAPKND